jgi:hypothetical protein
MKVANVRQEFATRVTAQQEHLLRAAVLSDGSDVQREFHRWLSTVDWEGELDRGTYHLLPLVFVNVDRFGVDYVNRGRLRGLYKRAWYRNEQILSRLNAVAERLTAAGTGFVLLGDVALIESVYRNSGARLADGLDLLVDPDEIENALDCLEQLGWRAQPPGGTELKYLSRATLTDATGELLRLHWHPLRKKLASSGCRSSTLGSRYDGRVPALPVLSPTGLLAELIAAGAASGDQRLLADVAGAYLIVKSGQVDWQAALNLADECGFNLRLFEVCSYLRDRLGSPVPDRVLRELASRRVCMAERLERRLARRDAESPDTFFGPLLRLAAQYARYSHGSGAVKVMGGFPEFLRHHYRMSSVPRILVRVIGNGARRVCRSVIRMRSKNPASTSQSSRLGDVREL